MTGHADVLVSRPAVTPAHRALGIALGALFVAAAAQVSVPLPWTPVPMTLQPLAVLAVGGVLGARGGLAALMAYLALGVAGLPVFAPGPLPQGAARLLGPTGGYLLAFPLAALAVGRLAGPAAGVGRLLLACAAGMAVIHLGGTAQLAILGGDPAAAFRLGFVPFFTNDLVKIGLAALLVLLLRRPVARLR